MTSRDDRLRVLAAAYRSVGIKPAPKPSIPGWD